MRVLGDVTITVSAATAQELIERAGIGSAGEGWLLPGGTRTDDPAAALSEALLTIGEDDLSVTLHESIERLS
jgi:hypothetical protein